MKNKSPYATGLLAFTLFVAGASAGEENLSSLVYPGVDGTLQYSPYANEGQTNAVNTIPDFSTCGYQAGGMAIPYVPVKAVVSQVDGDDLCHIQDAIDYVAGLPPDANGFRGAVLLQAGDYQSSASIYLNADGVVLRGAGQQKSGGTRITCTATTQASLIRMQHPSPSRTEVAGSRQSITDTFVPSGATRFRVADASGFLVGDDIVVVRHANRAWISDLGMDVFTTHVSGDEVPWEPEDYEFRWERMIIAVNGSEITIDAPVVQAIETQYGGGSVYKYTAERLKNTGVENLRLESIYASDEDEDHGWNAVSVSGCENSWVRQVTACYFGYSCVRISGNSKYMTVEDCAMLDPKSRTSGGRKYSFCVNDGQFLLLQRCYTRGGRHDYVTGSRVSGPVAFVDCVAEQTFSEAGPHHRYAHGLLFDNIRCGNLRVWDRGGLGSGHGWSGAQTLFWNCSSDSLISVQSPPSARNWGIGCVSEKKSRPGYWESWGAHITDPRSLYFRQLMDRSGFDAVARVALPQQLAGTIWDEISEWAGEGLLLNRVSAGADRTLGFDDGDLPLNGMVRDLSLLDAGGTIEWTQVDGPGTVQFGSSNSLGTSATFSSPGTYVLQMSLVGAGDPVSDTLTVVVRPSVR